MNQSIKGDTNRALWAEPPHHRPTKEELIAHARKNMPKQDLGSPAEEEQAEMDWGLKE